VFQCVGGHCSVDVFVIVESLLFCLMIEVLRWRRWCKMKTIFHGMNGERELKKIRRQSKRRV